MSISQLKLQNFRNLLSIDLDFSPGCNLIYGENGSGKTNLLESIYYLSLNRSFKTTGVDKIIHHHHHNFTICAKYEVSTDYTIPVGIEKQQSGMAKIRLNEQDVRASELTSLIPVRIINSYSHQLIESGPSLRREYIDWGIFYTNPGFLATWRQYERTLKQRNAALQQRLKAADIQIWSGKLLNCALELNRMRQSYVEALLPVLSDILNTLLPAFEIDFFYYPGWEVAQHYESVLTANLSKDYELGYTQFGPHKADLKISINQIPIKDFLSRGQQKLFVCGMIIAQGILLKKALNKRLIYLVDDLPSELDVDNQIKFMNLLKEQDAQLFITAIQAEANLFAHALNASMMFHVEHGKIVIK